MIKLISPLTQVDSSAKFAVGTKAQTEDGSEYIYLTGEASVAALDWVTFTNSAGSVVRLAANAKGNVGIAQAAIISNKWGWFQIKGNGWGNCGAEVSAGGSVIYSCGTTATVAPEVVAGDLLARAFFIDAGVSGGTVRVNLNYPFCTDTLS